MQQSKYMKWFAVAATIGMALILLGGALVTKTDSGMGCGRNWPDCNGSLIPTHITPEILIEFSHRVVTGSVSILIFILSFWSWRKLGHVREVKFLSFLALFFLIAQALIGAAQVLWGQGDFILALHFGISLISFAAVFLLTLIIFEVDQKFNANNVHIGGVLKWNTIGVTIYSYLVVYTGALVRHTNSSLICPDWPLCRNDQMVLPGNFYEWVQMGHRLAAGLIFIWVLIIAIHVIKHYKKQPVLYWSWIIALIIVCCQVIAGMGVVLTRLNIVVALLHTLFISLLFGLLCYMIMLISRSSHQAKK
ncbi:heme A synthase [Rummeliibacillus sp. G93]|uniref:COX15/CtaA family protein n=1 Tax=Rummeliibacillus TaxID=648802 RepID=UPI001174AB1F|nr:MULTISPECIES: heme A synthase [Rummeliibacillus]MBB5170003.1 cytochrome c oxidase assembly protein subunit 15 [Rummeliibacillus stabekisii]UQW98266.1 heme A synthase [Rummeliibacillus sp. G93]GEL04261.1 heme A synthase [Rummeliibacillus stabekisii]